jgi:hypothetical protein
MLAVVVIGFSWDFLEVIIMGAAEPRRLVVHAQIYWFMLRLVIVLELLVRSSIGLLR